MSETSAKSGQSAHSSKATNEGELAKEAAETGVSVPETNATPRNASTGRKDKATASKEKPSSHSSSSSPSSKRRIYDSSHMVKVFIPVSICMLIVVICVRSVETLADDYVYPTPYVFYREPDTETSTKIWQSLVNAGSLLIIVIIATFVIVVLFYFGCFCLLLAFVVFATINVLTVVALMQYHKILESVDLPVSVVLVGFLHFNFVVLALMALFWKAPLKLQQATLIIFAALVTLTAMQILPKWTTWALLIVMVIWDLVAVLTPCGPLRLLVKMSEKRGGELMPVLIYTGCVYSIQDESQTEDDTAGPSEDDDEGKQLEKPPSPDKQDDSSTSSSEKEPRRIRLGLGDFVFYSLLVGTASAGGDWATTLACYVSILTGLGFTLVLLVVLQQALPALPISVIFGVIAYFGSRFAMSRLVLEFNRKLILV